MTDLIEKLRAEQDKMRVALEKLHLNQKQKAALAQQLHQNSAAQASVLDLAQSGESKEDFAQQLDTIRQQQEKIDALRYVISSLQKEKEDPSLQLATPPRPLLARSSTMYVTTPSTPLTSAPNAARVALSAFQNTIASFSAPRPLTADVCFFFWPCSYFFVTINIILFSFFHSGPFTPNRFESLQ